MAAPRDGRAGGRAHCAQESNYREFIGHEEQNRAEVGGSEEGKEGGREGEDEY